MLIHLVRHACHSELGEVLSGRSEIGLNTAGRAQAERMAAVLSAGPIAAIRTSPRRRARETAQPLADRCALPIESVDALDEIDFGAWMGRAFADLANDAAWQHWNRARDSARPPGGETMRQAVARAVDFILSLSSSSNAPQVLVSHCDIIRGVVAHILGLPLDRLLAFDIDPGSVSTLSVGTRGSRIVSLNGRAA